MIRVYISVVFVWLSFVSQDIVAKDLLISTPKTSLVITATVGEPAKIQYYGARIQNEDIQSVYDSGLAFEQESYPAFGLRSTGEKAVAVTHPDGNMSLDLIVEEVHQYQTEEGEVTEVVLKQRVVCFNLL